MPLVNTDDRRLSLAFQHSSYLGKQFFVIEADEYDSAFFDTAQNLGKQFFVIEADEYDSAFLTNAQNLYIIDQRQPF
ncbi:UDP-N-acetylmuramate:L-alanyl-gamma-D-glutamyl- meso-diaminopimelate ligase [Moraxella catarrhalis]|nr:UDP-N-acetylmuramate:L-alanyl-gamma-D-glutamyl- meso-diaminopimelate ligase [Moraxella catarrhalis]